MDIGVLGVAWDNGQVSKPTTQRPPQVTLASGIVMFSSVVALLSVWESVTSLGSLETQQAIREVLADEPFASTGLTVNSATELLRISSMVAAACACATAILGWYVRTPDRSARLGLTIFAVPLFVSGLASGGLAGSFVAAGAAMLWLHPGREWFATGKWTPPEPPPAREARKDDQPAGQARPWGHQEQPPTSPPPATRPYGDPLPPQSTTPYGQPYGQPPAPSQQSAHAELPPTPQWAQHAPPRPGAMVAAFVITVVTAGGLLAMSLLWILIAGLSPDFLMSVLEDQQPQLLEDGLTLEQVRTTVFAISGAFIVWCAGALLLAAFAMARREWARRGLMVSAAFSAGACFALVLNTPLVLIPAAAALATVVCLRRVDVRRWFSLDAR